MYKEGWGNIVKWTRKVEIRKADFLTVGEAHRAISWLTPGLKQEDRLPESRWGNTYLYSDLLQAWNSEANWQEEKTTQLVLGNHFYKNEILLLQIFEQEEKNKLQSFIGINIQSNLS